MKYIREKTENGLPIDTNILTSEGFKQLLDIRPGHIIITNTGEFEEVKRIFLQNYQEIFAVRFSDGSSIQTTESFKFLCQNESEWNHKKKYKSFYLRDEKPPLLRTVEKISRKVRIRGGRANYRLIQDELEIEWPEKLHVVQPYTMGVLIGRGIFEQGVKITIDNERIIENINKELPYGISSSLKNSVLTIRNVNPGLYVTNVVFRECLKLGLTDNKVFQKHIPEEYLFDSVRNRKKLLRGLMDSNGTRDGKKVYFHTTSFQLAEDFTFLVQSLGGLIHRNVVKTQKRNMYKLLVKMGKEDNMVRTFKSIEFIGEKKCRSLGFNKNLSYITENFIHVKGD